MQGRIVALLVLIAALSPGAAMAKPSNPTTFQIEDKNGKAVAVFVFGNREHRYDGLLFCQKGHRFITVMDRENAVPPALRAMMDFPAEFTANGRAIGGSATYVARSGVMPAMVFFAIPLLDHQSFAGTGLMLSNIANPHMPPATSSLGDRAAWADAVAAFGFQITATNGEQALPPVFRDCSKP
ncbi:hypothetical protein BH10PSE6_BH10PSE6_45350 [soil metagenome]